MQLPAIEYVGILDRISILSDWLYNKDVPEKQRKRYNDLIQTQVKFVTDYFESLE
ncbi:MAG: hypothetical protein AAF518_11165 [Spirochaetota bacterium]